MIENRGKDPRPYHLLLLLRRSKSFPLYDTARITAVKARTGAERRVSAANAAPSRNMEEGGSGGTGWRQRRPPVEGAGHDGGGCGCGLNLTFVRTSQERRSRAVCGGSALADLFGGERT